MPRYEVLATVDISVVVTAKDKSEAYDKADAHFRSKRVQGHIKKINGELDYRHYEVDYAREGDD